MPFRLNDYLPVLLMFVVAGGFAVVNIFISQFIGQRKRTRTKLMPYECGKDPVGTARERFSVKFYMIAMIDLEWIERFVEAYNRERFSNDDRSSYASGKRIRVVNGQEVLAGTTRGLESDGALRVETDEGEIRIVRTGDVTELRALR